MLNGRKLLASRLLGDENYYLLRAYRSLWEDSLRNKEFLFVHTMGKVGSSSVVESLKRRGMKKKMSMHWTHFLSDDGLAFLTDLYTNGYGGWSHFPHNIKIHLKKSQVFNGAIKRWRTSDKRCKVITMVREPVKTNVSGFFQNYAWWPDELVQACKQQSSGYLDQLIAHFLDTYPHEVPVTWFDQEIRDLFGVDVLAQGFDNTTGYQIYQSSAADVLVIKLEQLDECISDAMQQFLGLSNFELQRENRAETKWYSQAYREFVQQVELPPEYAAKMYESKYAQVFYQNLYAVP